VGVRQRLQALAGRAGVNLQPRLQRILGFGEGELCLAALEQLGEEVLEVLVHALEGFEQPLAPLAVQGSDRLAQFGDGGNEIVALAGEEGKPLLDKDEHPRAGATLEGLAKLEPAFAGMGAALDPVAIKRYPQVKEIHHVHTAGNSSGIVDGAAALALASGDYAKALETYERIVKIKLDKGGEEPEAAARREAQVESACMVLLRRYGVVFYDLMERETAMPRWRELLGMFRRLESRGVVRGGRFVSGFGGEQFALPEALESLREVRNKKAEPIPVTYAAADPMNLVGIVIPGERAASVPGKTVTYPAPAVVEKPAEPREADVAADLFAFGAPAVEGGALA